LSWTTTNAIECSGSGDWEGTKATGSGSETLTLSDVKTYTFTLTCRGESSQNTVSKSVTVEVTESVDQVQIFIQKINCHIVQHLHHQMIQAHIGLKSLLQIF
jgi:hypothetical protein